MKGKFSKKVFTFRSFLKDIQTLPSSVFGYFEMRKNKQIGRALVEKIMTIVSVVNGCTYCVWFHKKQSLASGISSDELRNIINLQFKVDATPFELDALLFAQNFAQTSKNPDSFYLDGLAESYDRKTVSHIQAIVHLIYFSNLAGNTFDAFLSRLKGEKAINSNVFFELFFFILTAPILLPILPIVKRQSV